MPDNLTVTIGADSSKLRAELALVTQSTKAAQKELDALAATFNKTGQQADRIKLDDKARQLDTFKRSAASLKSELANMAPPFSRVKQGAEQAENALQQLIHTGHGLGRVVGEFSSVGRSFESIGRIFGTIGGGFAGGVFGVAITKAFTGLVDQINEASKALGELKKQAGEIGIKPIGLQAAQETVKKIGLDADVATNALKGMSAQIEETRKQSTQQPGAGGALLLKGGTGQNLVSASGAISQFATIIRGGADAVADFDKPLKLLGVDLSHIPSGKLGELQSYIAQLKGFMEGAKRFDTTGLNIISKKLFGEDAETMLKAAPALIANYQKQIDELQQAPRGATDAAIKRDEENKASAEKTKELWSDVTASIGRAVEWVETSFNKNVSNMAGAWTQFTQDMTKQSDDTWSAFIKGSSDAAATFQSIWSKVKASVGNTLSSGQGDAGLALPFASGGMVRGPGTSTSDNILARLSPGEFVVRAAAVRALGSGFLDSLNGLRNPGFALGGLVSTPPRFAEGGAVAGGGTPVHLHLGSSSFPLSGNENVVSALVVEAHRQQMRSAGNKPSWFAARPGGQ